MIYFSEIFGTKVHDQSGNTIGKLWDFIFLPVETAVVTKFALKTTKNHIIYIPIQLLKKNGIGYYLTTNTFQVKELKDTEMSVLKHLQDKQVIDLKGSKVIRANDVVIQDTPIYMISGIDVGALGVFRWIGLAHTLSRVLSFFNIRYKSKFLPWSLIQPIELRSGRIVLNEEKEKLQKLPPEDLADYLERTTTINALKLLKIMDPELSAHIIADVQHSFQIELFKHFSPQKAAQILMLIEPDEAVDILLSLSESKKEEIIKLITPEKLRPIQHLLKSARTDIGHLMTMDFLAVKSDDSARNVINAIRKDTRDIPQLYYIYSRNNQEQVNGVFNIHELIIQDMEMPVYKFMQQHVVSVRLTTPKEIAIKRMLKYHISALPVIDEERHIIGLLRLEDITKEILGSEVQET